MKFKCHFCAYSSDYKYLIKCHERSHNRLKRNQCPTCYKELKTKVGFKQHCARHQATTSLNSRDVDSDVTVIELEQTPNCKYNKVNSSTIPILNGDLKGSSRVVETGSSAIVLRPDDPRKVYGTEYFVTGNVFPDVAEETIATQGTESHDLGNQICPVDVETTSSIYVEANYSVVDLESESPDVIEVPGSPDIVEITPDVVEVTSDVEQETDCLVDVEQETDCLVDVEETDLTSNTTSASLAKGHVSSTVNPVQVDEAPNSPATKIVREPLFKTFPCHLCDKSFGLKCNLEVHLKSHARRICPICHYSAKGQSALERHVKQRHTMKTKFIQSRTLTIAFFECKLCHAIFSSKVEAMTHCCQVELAAGTINAVAAQLVQKSKGASTLQEPAPHTDARSSDFASTNFGETVKQEQCEDSLDFTIVTFDSPI